MKQKILTIILVLMTSVVTTVAASQVTLAKECKEYGPLGFPTWYRGLVDDQCNIIEPSSKLDANGQSSDENSVQAFVAKIALNIGDIIARAVGIIAVGFIMYGGIKYLLAQGNSSKLQAAKTIITNAIIGLIIAVLAAVIVNFVFNFFL